MDCTQPGQQTSFLLIDGVGYYLVSVMHESQAAGCGKDGTTVSFTVNGEPAGQSAPWVAGPNALNLNAGAGSPVPLPTATAAAAGGTSAGPTSAAPSATGGPSASASPSSAAPGSPGTAATASRPPVTSPGAPPPDDGLPWPAIVFLVVLVAALAVLGVGWWLRRKR
jgi:hypothetical protein